MRSRAIGFAESLVRDRRALAVAALVAAGCIVQAGWAGIDWTWEGFWNDVRLSRAYAAAGGEDIYPSAEEGVLSGHLYGPVGFYLYAPVRLASTPGEAIRLGVALSALLVLIPFAAALARGPTGAPLAALFLAAFFHLFWSASTQTMWNIHVDAPAVGLALLSWIALVRMREGRESPIWPLVAAGAAAASVWAKQTLAPVLILPALFLWLDGRRRQGGQVFGLTVGFAAALGLLFGLLYGFGDLWFTMFEIPSRHARFPGRLLADYRQFETLLDLAPVAAIAWLLGWRKPQGKYAAAARAALVYAAALLPLAVLGRIKISGAPNNYLGPDVFLTLAVCLAAAAAFRAPRLGLEARRRGAALLALILALQVARTGAFLTREAWERSRAPQTSASDEAFLYLRDQPGQAYFPWNPLAMAMAEGRLYHAAHGAVSLAQAGRRVSGEHWRAHVPEQARYLVLPGDAGPEVLELMPELSQRVDLPLLPRWTVWERPDR